MRSAAGALGISRIVDTNLLLYLLDPRDAEKQERALSAVERCSVVPGTALTTQILAELAVGMTSRLQPPLTPAAARAQLDLYGRAFGVLPVTLIAVQEALRGVDMYQLAFWDALIWAVALINNVPVILTEDMPGGREQVEGVRYANPLSPSFELDRIGQDL